MHFRWTGSLWLTSVLAVFSYYPPLYAQTTQINGRITDPAGQAVPGAQVTVRNHGTGVERETASNEEGFYVVPTLIPGNYSVRVMKPGFRTASQQDILVTVDNRTRADVRLEIGDVAESVTVLGDVAQLQTDTPEVSTTVLSRQYEQLPLVQLGRVRTALNFVYLAAGVQGQVRIDGADNLAATPQVSVHGGPKLQHEVWLDGLPGPMGFNEAAPAVEAMREFKLQTSQLSAEYGNTGHAVTSFALKSGTNRIHGSAFEFLRNNLLDARSWFAAERAVTRQNEFGATVGAPVYLPKVYDGRDRTFFFFSWTSARRRGLDNYQKAQIPTPAMLQGDFSGLVSASGAPTVIYDPATTRSDGKGGFVRDAFPGNRIPASRFDPVSAKLAALFPAPTLNGALNYGMYIGEAQLDPTIFTARFDHSVSNFQKVFYSFNTTSIPRRRFDTALPAPLSNGIRQNITTQLHRLGYDFIVRPNLVNTFITGLNRFRNLVNPVIDEPGWMSRLSLKGVVGDYFPYVTFSDGYTSVGPSTIQDGVDATYMFKDTVSWTHGRMNWRFGAEHRFSRNSSIALANTQGQYTFNPVSTALPGVVNTGNSMASMLLGQIYSASLRYPTISGTRRSYTGFFAQNDFKATNKLTLNLGLRFEYEGAPYEHHDRYSLVDLTAPNPGAGRRPGALVFAGSGEGRTGSRTLTPVNYSAWGPRAGLAYALTPRTVLRGGYGVYYGTTNLGISTGSLAVTASFTTPDAGITAPFLLADGFPQTFATTPVLNPAALNGQAATYTDADAGAMPRTQNWTFGVQRELATDLVLEANYIGNRFTGQVNQEMLNINQVDPRYLALGQLLSRNINSAEAIAAGIQAPYAGFTGTVAQALRPYPQYQTLTSSVAKAGSGHYQGAEFKVRRRFGASLSFEANYTWSKNIGYSSPSYVGYGAASNILQDHYNPSLERSLVPNDVPHALVFYYVWNMPFGKSGWQRHVIGGWSISGIHRYQKGYPVSVLMSNSLPVFNRVLRPDLLAGQSPASGIGASDFDPGRGDRVVNLNAFANPVSGGVYRFGTMAPTSGELRQFPVLGEDYSLSKKFPIAEGTALDLQCQVFNLLNRHRFSTITNNYSSSAFGQVTSSSLPRFVQISLRLSF